jgi:molybdenum-dependent DNA-binding transcriptional regulator ModE
MPAAGPPVPPPRTADEMYAKRLRVLALAEELGNISEACRIVGVSRRSFYEWKRIADEHGNEALYPKRAH